MSEESFIEQADQLEEQFQEWVNKMEDNQSQKSEDSPTVVSLDEQGGFPSREEKSPEVVAVPSKEPNIIDLFEKRVYIDDPSEVPAGATIHEGERGGLYYEEEAAEFAQGQMEADIERMEEHDFTDEQIQDATEELGRVHQKAGDIFGSWVETASEIANVRGGSHRTKAVGSALEKVHDRKPESYDSVGDLDDLHGSMLKVETIDEAQELFETIQDEYDVVEAEDKYGDGPYRAHHVIAEVEGETVELQIKQEDMSDIASASHKLAYKPETAPVEQMDTLDEPADEGLQEEINMCLEEMADYVEGIDENINCPNASADIIEEFFQITAS